MRSGRVVYPSGHHDEEGAVAVALRVSKEHPKATVHVVKVIETFRGVPSE